MRPMFLYQNLNRETYLNLLQNEIDEQLLTVAYIAGYTTILCISYKCPSGDQISK